MFHRHAPLILIGWFIACASAGDGGFAQEKSVNPGINKTFQDPKVADFVERFEREGREIYDQRDAIVAELGLKPGMSVADIGAGTGLFTRRFAKQVGPMGRVFAVDIAEKFVRHIEDGCRAEGIGNVVGVVCPADSTGLPAESIDAAFICDTYHHFEFPLKTMRSLHAALRPNGRLTVIDFHRIPGVTSDWSLTHVRAGQEVFEREILSAGFRRVRESSLLKDNYALEFVRSDHRPRTGFGELPDGPHGIRVHAVKSSSQRGPTEIRVLMPRKPRDETTRLPVVYLLPVEAANGAKYGDALAEVVRLDLHQRFDAIFVAPTFADLPWYADHPDDPAIQQESYLIHEVMPFIERTYPALAEPNGRLLVGFSKSGWGAMSLLLRHPGYIGRVAVFDAPLMLDRHDQFGSGPIFGSAGNFARYELAKAAETQSRYLGKEVRLSLWGDGNFQKQHAAMHQWLTDKGIPHDFQHGTPRKHSWDGGWLESAIDRVLHAPR